MRPSTALAFRPHLARTLTRTPAFVRSFSDAGPSSSGPKTVLAPGEPPLDSLGAQKKKRQKRKAEQKFSPIRSTAITIKALATPTSAADVPNVADLEKLRPPFSFDIEHDQYPKHYKQTFDTVYGSFRREQLFYLARQLQIPLLGSGRTKRLVTQSVLQHWGMPSPDSLTADEDDIPESQMEFPLLPSELFLLMGSDGSDLMRLSHRFQTHLQPVGNPLRLLAYGPTQALEELAVEIERLKTTMQSHTVQLQWSSGVRPDLVQMISRMSGAFIENLREGEIRITENDPRAFSRAQRLAERAGIFARDDARRPLISQLCPSVPASSDVDPEALMPDRYALYPFLVPGSLPWTIAYANPFRARRVGDWLSQGSTTRNDQRLSSGTWLQEDGSETPVKDVLMGSLPPTPVGWARSLSSTPGYLLVTTPGKESLTTTSLVPPISKSFDYQTLLNFLSSGKGRLTFLHGVPASIRTDSLKSNSFAPEDDVLLYRLRYRVVPKESDSDDGARPASARTRSPLPTHTLEFQINITRTIAEMSQAKHTHGAFDVQSPYQDSQGTVSTWVVHDDASAGITAVEAREKWLAPITEKDFELRSDMFDAREGFVTSFDVLLPDRPMDMRLQIADTRRIEKPDVPQVILDHFIEYCLARVRDRDLPESPFHLDFNDGIYCLESSSIIRSSMAEQSHASDIVDGIPGKLAKVVVENVAELDAKQDSLQCRVYASAPIREDLWLNFLGQCEQLTGHPPKRSTFSFNHSTSPLQRRLYA